MNAFAWVPGRGPMLFGWMLFGHILPFLGWDRIPCYQDGEPADHNPVTGETDGTHTCRLFAVEWLGAGAVMGRPSDLQPLA